MEHGGKSTRALRRCKFKPCPVDLWAGQNGKARGRRSSFQKAPPLLAKRILSELLISPLRHHCPQNKKVTWTGPTLFDVESAALKIMAFRSNHLHLSDT